MSAPEFLPRTAPQIGTQIVHRRYVDHGETHYAGNLASGAYVVRLFNDIATDLCIKVDHDEGLFASYDDITFHGPVYAGDILEVTVELVRVGRRSRTVQFEARVVARARPDMGQTASGVLATPLVITSATGTVVVPAPEPDAGGAGRD
ncbi:hotdog domain-containing protein [Nocardia jiangxiensis]|uniref:hotdog domain-containing protein n=1 Tax=Nocardia jiangxiensis TaxID=282685 RepID=UPI0002F1A50A|nr:hotdog domain-containing protein [Nocardia jiangxiensis]